MRAHIVKKSDLTVEQARQLEARLNAPEHQLDEGPRRVWDVLGYQPNLFAVVESATDRPIGAIYRAGLPHEIDAAWWLDSLYRGKGYASDMIDALAKLLKSEGATGIGNIRINTHQGQYDVASDQLKARLNARLADRSL